MSEAAAAAQTFAPVRIGLVSVSDRASSGVYEDKGIPALQAWLRLALCNPIAWETRLVPDEETLGGLRDAVPPVPGIFAAVPYCIDLIGGPYLECDEAVCKAFRPKSAQRPTSRAG